MSLSCSAISRQEAIRKKLIVLDVIRILGLEEIRHECIGDAVKRGISGGQRKRVNIGMEARRSSAEHLICNESAAFAQLRPGGAHCR